MNYLYFAENLVETGGAGVDQEAFMVPASYYLGADPISATTTALYFKDPVRDNGNRIKVLLTHANAANGGGYKNVVRALGAAMNKSMPSNDGFVVFADEEADNGTITGAATKTGGVEYDKNYNNCSPDSSTLTAGGGSVQITSDKDVIADSHGAGAVSTYHAPVLRRWKENGVIVTQLWVDLTGLGGKGGNADDVIGLPAGGAAYIYRNVVADNGIIFKYEISCIELPAAASGSATVDIDFNWNASGSLEYDGAAGTSEVDMGGLAAGQTHMVDAPALTANDYLYLTEGDTAATDGVYSAGQFLFTFYGLPVDAN